MMVSNGGGRLHATWLYDKLTLPFGNNTATIFLMRKSVGSMNRATTTPPYLSANKVQDIFYIFRLGGIELLVFLCSWVKEA